MSQPGTKTYVQRSGHKAATWGGAAALAGAWIAEKFGVKNPDEIAMIVAACGYVGGMLRTAIEQYMNPSAPAAKPVAEQKTE